ncbi:MAG: isopeptide-forming domain-containing fimbrial protein, partial [Chthoniobacteraceae bacterium]
MSRRKLLLETIEDRILCDAAPQVDPAALKAAEAAGAVQVAADAVAALEAAPAASTDAAAPLPEGATASAQLTDEQRAAIENVVRDSTNKIGFQENVGQFAPDVRYGFRTQFGGMLVYDDHISVLSNQTDPVTGEVGVHTVNIDFTGSSPWQIVPGGESGVFGSYQQADGTALTPQIYKEITLRNVYDGVDLRVYSAEQGILEFDWLVARAQDYEKIRLNFTGQDGVVFNADGSATLDLRFQDLVLKIPEVYQVIDGQKHLLGAAMVAGEQAGEMRYSLIGDIVADQPLVIDPSIAWSTYFELNNAGFDSYLYGIAINANGVYAFGWARETITNGSFGNYMEVNAGFSQGTAANQNYIYRLNTLGTNVTAWTSTGILEGTTEPSDIELFPDGRVLALFANGQMQIYSANLGTQHYTGEPVALSFGNSLAIVSDTVFYVGGLVSAAIPAGQLAAANIGPDTVFAGGSEGVIIRYGTATATPTATWGTYVGGNSTENFTSVALTPNGTKLVFATHSNVGAAYPGLVNAVDAVVSGATELLVGVLNEQATRPAAFDVFSYLGGTSDEGTTGNNTAAAVVTAVNGGFWVGGNTASNNLPGTAGSAQTANGGGTSDSFASYIPINGSAGTGFRSTYLGGGGNELIGGIAYDPLRDRLFLFGTTTGSFPTVDTVPTSIYYDSTFGGGTLDIFIATFDGALLTKPYATYIGGAQNDYLGDTGRLLGQGHVTYSPVTDQVYLATTVHSILPANVIGPTIPGKDTTRTNPETAGADAHVVFAFNISIYDYGDAPATYEAGNPGGEAISLFIRLGATVDAEATAQSGVLATGDDLFNTGAPDDEDGIATLPLMFATDTSYSVTVSALNNTGSAKTLQGWIDFNLDGVFAANERATVSVPANVAQQSVVLTWATLPGIVAGQSYVRLRFSETVLTDNGATTIDERSIGANTFAAGHGEVEDYALTINAVSSLSGFVYSELNANTTKDAFEGGIPGVTVTLTGTDIRGNAVNQSTTTNAAGQYTFSNLIASNGTGYTLTETQPAGYNDGPDTIGTPGGVTGADAFSLIVLNPGVNGANNNFGESPVFGLTKSLQTTSVAGTTGSNLAIGETATFRLVATIPAGSFTNFQLQDALPNGFQYVNGSAVVALVSSAGQLTSSTLAGAGLAQTSVGTPTFVMPDAAVSNNSTTNVDTYTSGADVFFKLGNLTNAETTAVVESVVIEFQAVVVNELANQAGGTLANTFSVIFDKDGAGAPDPHGGSSNTVTSTLVEPVLGVTKALVVSGTDAGDAVQYTITITNAGGNNATAYDINVLDLLDTDILLNDVTLGSGIVVAGATVTSNTSTTSNLNLVLDALAAGSSLTITLNAQVAATAPAGSTVTNSTNITWTSTPGANANERNGGGGVNDYANSAASATFVLARPTVDKLTPSDTTYSIGETVTYDVLVTIPEGVTTGLAITDNLPAGLTFVSVAVQTAAGGVLANAFAGTVPAPVTSNVGNSYTFTFGNTTATGDNDGTNNSFLVRVTGRIGNVAGNQDAVTLTNTATLAYADGTLGATTVNDPTPNVSITVVEPVLTLDKATIGTTTGLDAGDTVQYSITITNTGTATAHETLLSDALPAGLLVTTIDSTTPAGGASVDTATGGTGTATLTGEYTIPVGGSITIVYTATLQSSVTPNTDFINTATVTYTSVDGTALGQGTPTGERNGSGGINDYVLIDTAQVSTGGVLTVAKGVNNSTPSIGDVLTYTVTLTLNEGTTNGIVVTDTLPVNGDLQFVPGSGAISFGTAGSSISGSTVPAISGANSNVLTFTLGTAVVPAGAGANTVVLTYQVVVANVTTNQAGDMEANSASVVATNLPPPPPGTTTVTLREPNVTFTKNADVTSNVDAGDVITYTVVLTNPGGANASTAFDSLLVDTMPANLLVTGISSTVLAGGATTDSAAAITGGGAGLTGQYDIPVGATVTIVYTATVQTSFPTNGSLTNAAVLTWTSVNGGNSTAPDANERFGAGGSLFGDGSLNDYRRTTSATTTGAAPTFDKTLFSTSDATTLGTDVTIGEQVTYALLVTLPEGTTTGFNVLDTLPPGLRYVSHTIATTTGAGNPLTTNFGGTVPAPTFTGGATDGDDVNFAFGAITTNGDNNGANNAFAIMITAVVTDVPANSGVTPQTTLPNSGTFSGGGIPPFTPPPVTVTVTEPRLQITKGVDDTTADLGQTLTYTLTITHTASSTAAAYDLIIRDAIPAGFTLNTGSVNIVGGTIATNTSTASQLALTIDQFNTGGTITITYTAVVGTAAALGGTNQDNNVRLYWDTTAADTGTNTVLNGGADGDDDRDFGATPGYVELDTPAPDDLAQDTVRVTVNGNTVSGFVYLDSDSSGTRNGAETGLGVAVNVTISGTTFFGVPFSQTVAANAATGAYTFTNVPRSDATGYTITETQPGAFVDGIETAGAPFGGTTNNALGADVIANVVVPVGSNAGTGYNFGELLGSSISGFTYLDLNNDGTKQIGETGLGTALPVTLTGTDIFGQAVSLSGTSNAGTGAYSFADLRPSNGSGYTVAENDAAVVPATFFDGRDTAGSLGGTVVGGTPKFDAINVTVGQNQAGTAYNFGEINKSSLSGSVYADLDADGVFDAFESGVAGVTITLTGTDDQGAAVNLTVTTNASGAYSFANLRPSDVAGYTITETQPADYLDGADTIGTPGGTTNNDSFTAVVLVAGTNGVNNNFGEAPNFTLTKTLVGTSSAGTSGSNVAIGEVATFRLVVTIPAGSLTDFQVQDFLPAGYAFVNGSARAGLVGAVTSSTIVAPLAGIGSTPGFVLGDAAVSNNSTTNNDAYASGTDVFFKFGNLSNPDTTAAVEAIVIEFDAVVVNEAANVAGVTLTNNFGVLYDRDGNPGPEPDPNPPGVPPTVTTTVVAPVLTLTKNATPIGAVGAGDPITYTLTFTNIGGAFGTTGFDALITDTMPADILITSINSTVLAGGATTDNAAAITGGGTGLSGQYDIPVGGSVTITYTGTVQVTAAIGSTQINNAALTWTTINGGNSLTPDSGERFGAAGTLFGDGNLNNLRRIASQTVTVGTAAFDKQLFGTSDPATPGTSVGIGESVTYALIVTIPAGTAPSLSIIDTLPVGLQFVSSSIVTTVAGSNGFLTANFNGTVPAPTVTGGVADGDDVTFNFGAITANADGIPTNNTFLVLVTARVTDIAGNEGILPGQTMLDNVAEFDIPGDGVPPSTPPPVTVTVVEPVLVIDKEFNVTQADA